MVGPLYSKVETFLANLADILIKSSILEVDETSEGLAVLSPHGQYLLSYHRIMDQLWLSSPLSGAHHFIYKDSQWVCTRSQQLLLSLLSNELTVFDISLESLRS